MSTINTIANLLASLGFILACIGSAVGMGNIWMFPTRVSLYGGGSFLIPYIFFVALIGFTGVIAEMSFGRATRFGSGRRIWLRLRGKRQTKTRRSPWYDSSSRFPCNGNRIHRRYGLDFQICNRYPDRFDSRPR